MTWTGYTLSALSAVVSAASIVISIRGSRQAEATARRAEAAAEQAGVLAARAEAALAPVVGGTISSLQPWADPERGPDGCILLSRRARAEG